ncbi:MAG: Gfo/Idh/MocA family oxidoreductase [Fimbriimonadaceae bacterium]|nr:Gfo/Idh/MocA family oxidoreductase [Fimbriimonadaceae bacterium]
MAEALRAAVIGAGRIGRHHAKWYQRAGCRLVGYAVSQPASIAPRGAELAAEGCDPGPGFASYEELLEATAPDLVSVCTPAEAHAAPVRAALERGLAVLCEKPLTWSADPAAAQATAAELVALAARQGALLAVNLQYSYVAPAYRALVGEVGEPQTCEVRLASRGKGAERSPSEVWMELGPHALSLASGLLPGATLDLASLQVSAAPRTVTVRADWCRGPQRVATSLEVAQVLDGPLVRQCGVNGRLVTLGGRNNAAGEFAAFLTAGAVEREFPDWMRQSIEGFVNGVAGGQFGGVTGEAAQDNLAAQLAVAAAL